MSTFSPDYIILVLIRMPENVVHFDYFIFTAHTETSELLEWFPRIVIIVGVYPFNEILILNTTLSPECLMNTKK